MDTDLVEMLRRNHLNITTARLNILLLFYNKTTCLSHEDILKQLGNRTDRVTVYRTLRIFVKKEILYCIPTANNFSMYGLQNPDSKNCKPFQHAHFICERCGKIYPLESVEVQLKEVPQNFIIRQCDIVMNGKCNNCH